MAQQGWTSVGALLLHQGWGAWSHGAVGRQHPPGSLSPASQDGASMKKVLVLFINLQAGAVYPRQQGE